MKLVNSKNFIYLDNAATTPVDFEVQKEMEKYGSKLYGNPSSLHLMGRLSKEAIDGARIRISKILNCGADEIIFIAGGTESDNLAVFGIARAYKKFGNHIIVSKIEHHAVLEPCEALKKEGFEITYLNVDRDGIVDLEQLKKSLKKETILVSIMYANNEIGTIQPIAEISKIISQFKTTNYPPAIGFAPGEWRAGKLQTINYGLPFFHSDACQAAGYLDLNVEKLGVPRRLCRRDPGIKCLGVDLLTLNGSKIYGPKQIGLLYKKSGIKVEPLIYGGGQEFGLRAGTENVPSIVGLAKALELVEKNKMKESKRLADLRDYLIKNILTKISKTELNGHLTKRLPNNVNVSILDIEGESIILMLDDYKICASTGSACTSKSLEPSHVIVALGKSDEYAHSSVRFTLGKFTKKSDLNYLLKVLPGIVERLRKISPLKT